MAATFKVIKPTAMPSRNFQASMNQIAEDTRVNLLRNFRRTTKTWDIKVKFQDTVEKRTYRYTINVFANSDLYHQINWGTMFITDILSKNFQAKTKPGVLDSFPGRGGRIGRGGRPRPGIIPRRWDLAAAQVEQKLIVQRLTEVLQQFVRESGHKK